MFKDYFSELANDYRQYRPMYPNELFTFLASVVPERELAWDCGTGNGQAAVELACHFNEVIATDASADQIKHAIPVANVIYEVAPAEKTRFADHTFDLITVAQALHWFDFSAFYAEVNRVLKPNGVIAAWCYTLCHCNKAIDSVIKKLYKEITDPYWPPERRYIDEKYQTIPFPFKKIKTPQFFIHESWELSQYLGYLNTWSGVKAYEKENGVNPLHLILPDLIAAWGDEKHRRKISWEIHLLAGKV